jgi:O-antigen/teichoic acid export membrane protein
MLQKVVSYALFASAFTGGVRLLTFAVGMLAAHLKGKGAFGDYTTYVLVFGITQSIFINGCNQAIQKFGADDEEGRRRFALLAYITFFVTLLIGVLCFLATGLIFGKWALGLAFLAAPGGVLWWWARYLFRSTLNPKGETALTALSSLSNAFLILGFLKLTAYDDAIIYGDFAAYVVSGLAAFICIPIAVKATPWQILKTPLPRAWLAEIFKFSLPLWWAGQLFTVGGSAQGLITRGHPNLGTAPMAEYGVMGTLAQFIHHPIDIVGHAALPGLVLEKDKRDEMFRELLRLCLLAFPFLAISISAGVPLLMDIMDWAFQFVAHREQGLADKYSGVYFLLLITALGTPGAAAEIVTGQYAIVQNRPDIALKAKAVSLGVILISLLPLTNYFGLAGVVFAGTVLGEFSQAFTYIYLLWGDYKQNMKTALVYTSISVLGSVLAALPVILFRDMQYPWLLAFVAMAIYVAVMWVFGLLHAEDFRRLFRVLKGRETSEHEQGFEHAPEGLEEALLSPGDKQVVRQAIVRRASRIKTSL